MANISHGMNISEVQDLGNKLKQISQQITDMVNMLNGKVNSTSWLGPDASRFKDQWWPQHRQHLQATASDLSGFGRAR